MLPERDEDVLSVRNVDEYCKLPSAFDSCSASPIAELREDFDGSSKLKPASGGFHGMRGATVARESRYVE